MTTQVATRIIDGDGHIVEEQDAIISFLREPYRNARIRANGLFPAIDHLHFEPFTPLPGAFSPAGPDEWERFLATVGIESTVLYPSQGLAIGNATNRDWTIALCAAYNDWIHARYMKRSSRFKAMALLPMQDPEAAVVELRRAVLDLGMPGGMLPSNGLSHPVGSKQYWPVYAEAERLGCALAVHGGIHAKMGLDYLDVFSATHAIGHPLGQIISATSIIFNGVFDRFPGIRIGFLEGGVAWLLMLLERYDRSYWTHLPFNPRNDIVKPLEGEKLAGYIIRQMKERRMFIGCEGEEPTIGYAVKQVGNEPFFFSSDFPHEVNIEMCQHELSEIVENHELSDADKQAILYKNSAAFYALK
jgi:predicted TIM-barrel fold metal-dependent hydrolase